MLWGFREHSWGDVQPRAWLTAAGKFTVTDTAA